MFSFFKKQIADINSIIIPDFNWNLVKQDESIIRWVNPEQTSAISVNFFELQPDLPTIVDIDKLRAYYRQSIVSVGGGVIEIEILKIKNTPVVKTIFKIPQESSGTSYIASLTIPFESCSYVIKAHCLEVGTTGLRESLIANKMLSSGELKIQNGKFENWVADPYDTTFKEGYLMNKSELSFYDSDFPNHPLTQVRIIVEKISNNLNFKSEIKKLTSFNL